jgi:hypothetical protein
MSDPLSDMSTERAAEYLAQLQSHIDALSAKNAAQRARIGKLEADRETLRTKLAAARSARRSRFRRSKPDVVIGPEVAVPEEAQATLSRRPIRVAAIVDEFTEQTFGPEWSMVNLSRDSWQADLEAHQPELLFVESAFSGAGATWAGELARFGTSSKALQELVRWCNTKSIPTVFWNKEDPSNFEIFIETARLFDFIFTVDLDSLERYDRHVPGTPVNLLPFAAQPDLHYPPGSLSDRTGGVAFAGGYYAAKLPDRRSQMELIIAPALAFNLDIFDRFGGTDSRFAWPDKYQAHIRGRLTYLETVEMYRRYKVALNVNSVTASTTMCSRRIFELLACGAYVVSGPSAALGAYVPPGLVQVASTADEARDLIGQGLTDPSILEIAAEQGPAWIAEGQTYSDRVDEVLRILLG